MVLEVCSSLSDSMVLCPPAPPGLFVFGYRGVEKNPWQMGDLGVQGWRDRG